MVASGFAGLGYQIVWTQQSALWLGHESAAVLAVVAAFFGGLAVGALALGSRIERSATPGALVCGVRGGHRAVELALALLLAPVTQWLLELIGAQPSPAWQWSVAFCGIFLLLLPATAAMGATLPAMERVIAQLRRDGTLASPRCTRATRSARCSACSRPRSGWCRSSAWRALPASVRAAESVCARGRVAVLLRPRRSVAPCARRPPRGRRCSLLLAATGLLGIGYEVLVVRVLSQVAENTVYTFAMLLAVYLVGTALGAAAYQRWLAGHCDGERLRDHLLCALAVACLLGMLELAGAETVKSCGAASARRRAWPRRWPPKPRLRSLAFLLPTLSWARCSVISARRRCASGISFGRALGVNTLGAAVCAAAVRRAAGADARPQGRAAAGRCGLPGARLAARMVTPIALGAAVRRGWRSRLGAAAGLRRRARGRARRQLPRRRDGGGERGRGRRRRGAPAHQQPAAGRQQRDVCLPMRGRRCCRCCCTRRRGARCSSGWAPASPRRRRPGIRRCRSTRSSCCRRSSKRRVLHAPVRRERGTTPRLHLMAADARRFVRATEQRYDVIVVRQLPSGAQRLRLALHRGALRGRARAARCRRPVLPMAAAASARSADRCAASCAPSSAVYPRGWAMLATNSLETPVLGLLARAATAALRCCAPCASACTARRMPRAPAEFGIADELALLGSFIAGPKQPGAFRAAMRRSTRDDHPVVAYRAPRITYAPDSLPRDRLIALAARARDRARRARACAAHDATWASRLAAYWAARNRFIEAGRDVRPAADVRADAGAGARAACWRCCASAPTSAPPTIRCCGWPPHSARTDAAGARALLTELVRAQPARLEAAEALARLEGASR